MIATTSMYAQDVDKATVTGNADAAKSAGDDLKKVDTGDKAWKFDGVVGLNAAATGLVNWAAGGKNNVNGVAYAKLHLLYHKDAVAWETNFDTDFGMSYIDQDEDPLQKTNDNIKLATKFGWEFHENWYLTVLGGFQSQYALGRDYVAGYNPAISKWLAPSYTDVSVGIDWKKSYNGADFSVYLSPIAGRIATAYVGDKWNDRYTKEAALGNLKYAMDNAEKGTVEYNIAKDAYDVAEKLYTKDAYIALGNNDFRTTLQDKYGTYGYDDAGEKLYKNFRAEFGLSFKGAIAYKYENLTLGTTLALFTPYAGKGFNVKEAYEKVNGAGTYDGYFEYSNNNRYFGHFDVDWDVNISYQFLKVLNVTLSTSLKYYNGTLIANKDGVEAERVQFKSVVGLGIGYSF
ncbi:MAG: DUF3078 domain-containing protein [Paludibacteraceae bacterium]|nr:DUF3078 domain-containing protein [Paludibacteraceae bacterium]